jgi:uncharacterized protein
MTGLASALLSGIALGFAGSLHCACMCGGISSGCLFMLDPQNRFAQIKTVLELQAGRIFIYGIGGAIVASVASLSISPAATSGSYRALQWAGAAALMWVGLSMARLVPSFQLPAGFTRLPVSIDRALTPLRRHPRALPFVLGMTWGLTPCPLVYAALFTSTLMGSAFAGFVWMIGFGMGTVPAIVATTLGVSKLAYIRKSQIAQTVAGLAIALFAILTVSGAGDAVSQFCGLR